MHPWERLAVKCSAERNVKYRCGGVKYYLDGELVEHTYDKNSNLLTSSRNGVVYSTTKYNKANLPVETTFTTNNNDEITLYFYTPDGHLYMSMGDKISSMF